MLSIPKGNALFEKELLSVDDVSLLIENLKDEKKFSGYIHIAGTGETKFKAAMLFFQGIYKVSFNLSKKDRIELIKRSTVISKIKQAGTVLVSIYIMSDPILEVLANAHVFSSVYPEKHNLKKNELGSVTDSFLDKSMNGIMKLYSRGKENILVFRDGSLIYDNFSDFYGPILVNQKQSDAFFDFVNKNGGTVEMIGAEGDSIQEANIAAVKELERSRELVIEVTTGWGKLEGDEVRVDENIFREWGISNKNKNLPLKVKSPSGYEATLKVSCQTGVGQKLRVSAKAAEQMRMPAGTIVTVVPTGW